MRSLTAGLACSLVSMCMGGVAFAKSLPIDKIFAIERGFDNNDIIEFAVHGYLPDTCHQIGETSTLVDSVNKTIYVTVEGHVKERQSCAKMLIPFLKVVRVGVLSAGTYRVLSAANQRVSGQMKVAESSTEDQDEFLYAPVEYAKISRATDTSLTLEGTYPATYTGCMRIVDVKAYLTGANILVVRPVAQLFEDKDCDPADVDEANRFAVKTSLPVDISGKGLVHVRTLNGQAYNKLFQFAD